MGKMCGTAIGVGLAGAIIGMHLYMCMSDRDQNHINRGLKDAVDDLRDMLDRVSK